MACRLISLRRLIEPMRRILTNLWRQHDGNLNLNIRLGMFSESADLISLKIIDARLFLAYVASGKQ